MQLFLLFWMLYAVAAYPSRRRSDILKKWLSTRMDESSETSEDYSEKMAELFDIPLPENSRKILKNCQNILCMPYYLCINDMVVTNGTELFELRIGSRSGINNGPDMVCGHMEMPCCADEAIKYLHQNPANETQSDHTGETMEPDDYEENKVEEEDNVNIISPVTKCGYGKRQNTATRIINGDEAHPNEFPWILGLFIRLKSGNLRYLGGASLIHESVIMTAAHLVADLKPKNLVVRAGEHDILSTQIDENRQEQNVTNIIVHENVYTQSVINDIALLVLEKPFKLTEAVSTICLPPQSIQTHGNTMCTSGGWGKNAEDRHGKYQAILKKVNLPIVAQGKCEQMLRRTERLGQFFNLDDSLMCAGGERRDTCKGDGGSPLFCEIPHDKGRFYQTGIVAGGLGCGGQVPGLYVNVAHFSNWISHQLGFINMQLEPQNVLHYELFD